MAGRLIRIPDAHALVSVIEGVVLQRHGAARTVAVSLVEVLVPPQATSKRESARVPVAPDHLAQRGGAEPKTGV